MNQAATPSHKRMSATDRRDQLLDVTQQIVAKDGFVAVTMKRLAEEAGISRTVIYQQFGDLTGALVALIEREFHQELGVYLKAVSEHPGGGTDQFVAVIGDLLQGVDNNPAAWRLFLMPPEGSPPELHQRLSEGRALVKQYLIDSLKGAKQDGMNVLFQDDLEVGASSIFAMAENLLALRLEDPHHFSHQRLLDHVRVLSNSIFQPVTAH